MAVQLQPTPVLQAISQVERDIVKAHNKVDDVAQLSALPAEVQRITDMLSPILAKQSQMPNEYLQLEIATLRDDLSSLKTRVNIALRTHNISPSDPGSLQASLESAKPTSKGLEPLPSAPLSSVRPSSKPGPIAPLPAHDAPEGKGEAISPAVSRPAVPFTVGPRAGIKNASMNCWANALLQFIRHIPSLYNFIQDPRNNFKVLQDFYKEYNTAKDSAVASKANSQLVREWLSIKTRIKPERWKQEDASEALNCILNRFPPHLLELRRATGEDGTQVVRDEGACNFLINVRNEDGRFIGNMPLDQLFVKNYLWGKDETRRFYDTPKEMIFQINRNQQWPSIKKIDDPVNIPLRITIPARSIIINEDAILDCDAFISHEGSTMSGGHYVAYRKFGSQWYKFDDSRVTPVTEARIKEIIKKAYILHYTKVKV